MNNKINNFDIDDLLKEFGENLDSEKDRNMGAENTVTADPPSEMNPVFEDFVQKAQEVDDPVRYIDLSPNEQTKKDSSFTNDIEFDVKFRGYDKNQVDHYIDAITEDYNAICAKLDELEKENEGLRRAVVNLTSEAVT